MKMTDISPTQHLPVQVSLPLASGRSLSFRESLSPGLQGCVWVTVWNTGAWAAPPYPPPPVPREQSHPGKSEWEGAPGTPACTQLFHCTEMETEAGERSDPPEASQQSWDLRCAALALGSPLVCCLPSEESPAQWRKTFWPCSLPPLPPGHLHELFRCLRAPSVAHRAPTVPSSVEHLLCERAALVSL